MADVLEDITVSQVVTTHLVEAARLFEQAVKTGCQDPHVHYMLALCYKGMGKLGDARNALRKIARPDANVALQMGLLSFAEKAYAQAEQEFAKAWELDPASYESAYNLMLARLMQGQTESAASLIPRLTPLCGRDDEQRFLALLEALLATMPRKGPGGELANGAAAKEAVLRDMTAAEEQRLLHMLGGLGHFDVAYPLLRRLAAVRPDSMPAQSAYLEVALV